MLPPQFPWLLVAVLLKADGHMRLTIGIFFRHMDVTFVNYHTSMKLNFGVILFLTALSTCSSSTQIIKPSGMLSVQAELETDEVLSAGDAADDPAIWVSPNDPNQSLIFATDKRAGLFSFDLEGRVVQRIIAGRLNNVDLRPFVEGPFSALVAASNRSTDSVSLFLVDQAGQATWIKANEIATGLDDPYGLCMHDDGNNLQVFVNDSDGRYQQWLLDVSLSASLEDVSIGATLVREWIVADKPEGCAVDDATKTLYLGIESSGVYSMSADLSAPVVLDIVLPVDGDRVVADVEGMDVYRMDQQAFLIVSSQGNHSFAVVDLESPHRYLGSFTVDPDVERRIDGAEETDGIAVVSGWLTSQFSEGLLVVQDGYNTEPTERQNFKYVSWKNVAETLHIN